MTISTPGELLVVLTTLPDPDSAERMANALVEQKLAACVNIHGLMTSIYRWRDRIERGTEQQLVIKTTATRYAAVEQLIKQEHPYELPEILALPVSDGLADYLEWVDSCTKE
jgi:periplasmic divalent cation tolerance protein